MLRMMTFGGCATLCTRDATSMPFIFGIPMSTMSTSTRVCSQKCRACSPSAASPTTWTPGSDSSRLRSPRLTMPWSSASKTCNRSLRRLLPVRRAGREPEAHRHSEITGAPHRQPSLQFLDALFHPLQPEAERPPRRIESPPIVGHRDLQPAALARQLNDDACRLGVPDAVGQGLLDDAVDTRPLRVRRGGGVRIDVQLDHEAGAAGHVAKEPLERRLEAEIVEHAGTQA